MTTTNDDIIKDDYEIWEKTIIDKYKDWLNEKKITDLIPTTDNPSSLSKEKYILVVLPDANMPKYVANSQNNELPGVKNMNLYHRKKKEMIQ